VLINIEALALLSSCKQRLKTVTVNPQVAVLPAASVAVQVTVVVPFGKADGLASLHDCSPSA
jgi:uncharacterized lipoprotein YajG